MIVQILSLVKIVYQIIRLYSHFNWYSFWGADQARACPCIGTLIAAGLQQLELKKRRERAVACRKYLYDFGMTYRVGEYLLEGGRFPYTPVKAANVWDEARGYSFNMPAMSDENRNWVRSKLDGDGYRLSSEMQFRFRVEPGKYRLSLGFGPFEDTGPVMVEGLKEPLKLVLSKKAGLAEADIVITSTATLSVSHKGYGDIRWLSLIEKN